jgi:hypothetical protein
LGNKTALSNKTDESNGPGNISTPTNGAEMMSSGMSAKNRKKTSYGPNGHPIITGFSPNGNTDQDYMQYQRGTSGHNA